MNDSLLTSQYNSLIVDNESVFSQQLNAFISQTTCLNKPLIAQSASQAFAILLTTPIDLLFLDVQLPDMSGLDLLKALPKPPTVIITSARSDMAVDFFDLDVADFLLKPYNYSRFLRAITRAIKHTVPAPLPNPVRKVSPPSREDIYLKSGRRLERFAYQDIHYIEAYGLYTKLHTADGVFAVSRRISSLPEELPTDQFIRIHKSYIINIAHLKRVELKQVWIKSTKLPIGITYRPAVDELLKDLGIRKAQLEQQMPFLNPA